jgi:hypothetical protein
MPVTVTFDKSSYRIGEPAEITISGLTAGNTYHVKLKNSVTNAETPLFDFIAPGTSVTVKTNVQYYWVDYDKIVVDGDVNNLPSILREIYSYPPKISTDQMRYKRGEAVTITLSNLITGNTYRLKITVDTGEILIKEFSPTGPVHTELYAIPSDFPLGVHRIRLYQTFSPSELLVVETAIEVFEPTTLTPMQQMQQQVMNFIQQYWWLLLIGFVVLLLLFRRRR